MNLKDKIKTGIYASLFSLTIPGDCYARQESSTGVLKQILTTGYTNELLAPFGMYFMLKAINGEKLEERITRPFTIFMLFSGAEFLQKAGFPGVYDEKDFLAYAVGVTTAVIVDQLSFKKKGLEDKINE